MKTITYLTILLILAYTTQGYVIEDHEYGTTDWDVWLGLAYNGYNYCSAYLDVNPEPYGTDFTDSMTEEQDNWTLTQTLNYGPIPSCNITFEVYGIYADLNFTVNYTKISTETTNQIYGPLPSEYTESEGYYSYDTPSTNHVNYSSACSDIFSCTVEVINNTDESILYIQNIAGEYDCNNLIPYAFTLSYSNQTLINTTYNSNQTFTALPYSGYYRSNRTIKITQPYTCTIGAIHYCNITVINTTDDSILYTASISAMDDQCLNLNNSGGNTIGNGSLFGNSCNGSCVLGQTWTQFRVYIALFISLCILVAVQPFKLGAISSAISITFFSLALPGAWLTLTNSMVLIYDAVAIFIWFEEGKK